MIELRTPYGSFDLAPDFKISIAEENNALQWGSSIKVERAYPTTLPWTPKNAQIWMHADIMESHSERLKVQCELVIDGNTEFKGVCNLLQTLEGKSYSVNLTYNRDVIDPEQTLDTLNFDDVLTQTITVDSTIYTAGIDAIDDFIDGSYPQYKYAYPVLRQDYSTFQYINEYDVTTNQYRTGRYYTPMFYMGYVLERIAASWGLKLEGSIEHDAELQKVLVFNVRLVNNSIVTYAGKKYFTYNDFDPKNHMPKVTISEFFTAIRTRFGCGIRIDTVNGKLLVHTVRDNRVRNTKIDVTQYVKGKGFAEVTPDDGDNLYEQTQDNADTWTQYVKPTIPKNYKGTTPSLASLFVLTGVAVGDVYLVLDTDYYWVYNGATWNFLQYRLHDYKIGPNRITDSSGAVVCDLTFAPIIGASWKTPRTAYPKEDVENNLVEPTLRFTIYQGLQNVSGIAMTYPMASIDHKDTDSNIIGEMDLRDDGDYGLYNRYKRWRVQLLSNRRKPTFFLKECNPILHQLTPDKTVMVQSQEYMWLRKTRTYDINNLVDVELEAVKL